MNELARIFRDTPVHELNAINVTRDDDDDKKTDVTMSLWMREITLQNGARYRGRTGIEPAKRRAMFAAWHSRKRCVSYVSWRNVGQSVINSPRIIVGIG